MGFNEFLVLGGSVTYSCLPYNFVDKIILGKYFIYSDFEIV